MSGRNWLHANFPIGRAWMGMHVSRHKLLAVVHFRHLPFTRVSMAKKKEVMPAKPDNVFIYGSD